MSVSAIEDIAKNLKELSKIGQKKESELIKKRAEVELAQEELLKLGVSTIEEADKEIARLTSEINSKSEILDGLFKSLQDLVNGIRG